MGATQHKGKAILLFDQAKELEADMGKITKALGALVGKGTVTN